MSRDKKELKYCNFLLSRCLETKIYNNVAVTSTLTSSHLLSTPVLFKFKELTYQRRERSSRSIKCCARLIWILYIIFSLLYFYNVRIPLVEYHTHISAITENKITMYFLFCRNNFKIKPTILLWHEPRSAPSSVPAVAEFRDTPSAFPSLVSFVPATGIRIPQRRRLVRSSVGLCCFSVVHRPGSSTWRSFGKT